MVASSDSGRQVGDLELVAPLSVDGLAELFLATAPGGGTLKKFVLLQQLCPPFRDDPEFTRRFLDDARLTAGLTHPNVARVLKLGRDPARGDPYLATELIGGKSLAGLVKIAEQHGFQLPLPLACRIVHDLCLGLQAAHELADASGAPLGVVHGDVTPRNVMVTFDGHAKVLDLGISRARRELRLTHPELAKGTLGYISPEQVLGHPIDARTDLFAAATILFELISGRKMFPNELAAPHAVVMERPPAPSTLAPDVPPDLDDAVLRALEKNPDQRHASAYDFACALAAAVPLAPTHEVSELMTRLFADDQHATQALLATLAADDPDAGTLYAWLSRWEGEGVTHRPPPVRPVAPVRATAAWPAELPPPPAQPALAWPAELSPPPVEPAVAWPAELAPPPAEPAVAWPAELPPPSGSPAWPAALEAAPGATWSTEFAAPPGRLHTSTTPAWPSVLAPPPIAPLVDEPLAASPPGPKPPARTGQPRAGAAPAPALDEPLAPAASWPAELVPPPATTRPSAPPRSAWPSELAAPPGPGARPSGLPAAPAPGAAWPSELSTAPDPAAAWPAELSAGPTQAAAWPSELAAAPDPAAAWPAELSAAPPASAWPAELSAPPAPALAPGRPPADWPSELAPPPPRAAAPDLPPPPGVSWPGEVPAEAAAKPERALAPKTAPVPRPTAPGETSSVEAALPQSKAKLIGALALLLVAIALFVAWYTGAIGSRSLPPPRVEEPVR